MNIKLKIIRLSSSNRKDVVKTTSITLEMLETVPSTKNNLSQFMEKGLKCM